MVTGSCLCNTVRWQVDGPLSRMSHCHCSICRKMHGGPFATYVNAQATDFSWQGGKGAISTYESSPGFHRNFCGECGSVVPVPLDEKRVVMPAGCLDGDLNMTAESHIFYTDKLPWLEINDHLPCHDGYPQPDDGPNIANKPLPAKADGVFHGSCQCGGVAFELRGPLKVAHNCHCGRCRKARAAAHTTNGFAALDDVVFLRGEDQLKTYKLPEAKLFSVTFCQRCGSGMPRMSPERQLAIIPLAVMDDHPEQGPIDHIFVGSKSDWYPITDDLPQFEEMPTG